MSTLKPCIDCGTLVRASRCRKHAAEFDARRGSAHARGYDKAWQRLSAQAIAEQPWCSVDGCTDDDLTTDHVVPIKQGGPTTGLTLADVVVLCRSHNSSKGGR